MLATIPGQLDLFTEPAGIPAPETPAEIHKPSVTWGMQAIPGQDHREMRYRGCCLTCGWAGPERDRENAAALDANDHAWPGWRGLPVISCIPQANQQAKARWIENALALYPPGWLEAGGPILTDRMPPISRHVPDETPWGGYSLAVGDV